MSDTLSKSTCVFILAALLLTLAAGCATVPNYKFMHEPSMNEAASKRAAYELDCPKEQLSTERLSKKLVGVDGCGTRAVYYFESCVYDPADGSVQDCDPILNSTSEGQ